MERKNKRNSGSSTVTFHEINQDEDTANEQFKKEFESRLSPETSVTVCPDTQTMFREAGEKWCGDPTYEQ